jgi:hypothetical protein
MHPVVDAAPPKEEVMSDWYIDPVAMHNQNVLANGGNFVGPQQGPTLPRDYYWEPRILDCGHSEEDCDGIECGILAQEPDPDLITEDDIDLKERDW